MLLVSAGLTGCIGSEDVAESSVEPVDDRPKRPTEDPGVVVAVVDSGINLYHAECQAPDRWPDANATSSPSSASKPAMLERAPVDPTSVELTRDVSTWEKALERDEKRLEELETEQLYTFPATKILGGISFDEPNGDWPVLLDRPGGHGTMTSSRAVGNTVSVGGADPGIWLVMVQGFNVDSIEWAAQQDWIDMISVSSGLSLGGLAPGAANVIAQDAIDAFHHASHEKPLFASTGNGVANVGMAGFPSWLRGASGVPDAVSVGATDNGNLAQWDNQDSYVAADGCGNPAARADSLDEVGNHGGGTSSATPFSAGAAANMLLEARRMLNDTTIGPHVDDNRSAPSDAWDSGYEADANVVLAEGEADGIETGPLADGVFTMREFKDVLYHTALVTPTEDASDGEECGAARNGNPFGAGYVDAETVPKDARFPSQGYGEVNANSTQAAIDVLEGDQPIPERPGDDEQYERAHSMKETFVAREQPASPAGVGER
jgi:hypothetical protein